MNRYDHYPGDYARDTAQLNLLQHGAYRLLLDHYYSTEKPIEDGTQNRIVRAFTKEEQDETQWVLDRFFKLADGFWRHERADREIAKAQPKLRAARQNGRRGGRPRKTQSVISENPVANPVGNPTETQEEPTGEPNRNPDGEGEGDLNKEREQVVCPNAVEMFPDTAVAQLAKQLSVSVEAIRAEVKSYSDHFRFGGGINSRRQPHEWRKACRQRLLTKSQAGTIVEPKTNSGPDLGFGES